ncbi:hypothetical protein D3C80_1808060 [compost metagenome]
MSADRSGAGEGDFIDALAGRQCLSGFFTEALNHIEYSRWQQVANHFQQHADAERRLLGRFEHHAVTGSQRRSQFPGCHQ